LDIRLVPNMTKEDTLAKLRAHLDEHGFQDVEIVVGGGYSPTETDENAGIIRAARAVFERVGVKYALYPRQAGS
jgi:acetylornithine deacetylase/succinyl-diaminopimelate desuccinylase-like protein